MKAALDLIKKHEGLRLNAYRCPAGKWTIGYGNTHYLDGWAVQPGDSLQDEKQAAALLEATAGRFAESVDRQVKVALTTNQRLALISFVYNVGGTAFGNSTLLKLLNAGNYFAAAGQFGRWIYSGKTVLPGLVRRRQEERKLFLKP